MSDLREGQQVCAVNVIHRPTGTAWPGTTGTIRRIARPGPFPTDITVQFPRLHCLRAATTCAPAEHGRPRPHAGRRTDHTALPVNAVIDAARRRPAPSLNR
jgi:hypothetical protein